MTPEQAAQVLMKLDAILGALAAIEDAIRGKSEPKRPQSKPPRGAK